MAGESRSRQPFVIADFRPGLATEEGPGSLPPGAATETLNTTPSPSGALSIRPTTRQLDNLGFGHRPDVSHSLMVTSAQGLDEVTNIAVSAHGSTSFLSAYAADMRATNDQMNVIAVAHGANRRWFPERGGSSINFPMCPVAFATLYGQTVWISNRAFGRVGFAADNLGNVTPYVHRIWYPQEVFRDLTGCIAIVHHGRLFVAGNNSFPAQLRWSRVGLPCPEPITGTPPSGQTALSAAFNEAWPSTNMLNVDGNGSTNDPISGLASFGNTLWVFTTGAVYQISGADWDEGSDIVIQVVPGAAGCVSPRTVWTNDAGIFYVSTTGPKRVDRSRYEDISAQVRRSFDTRALEHSHALLTPERYLVTLPSLDTVAEVPNAISEYDSTTTFPSWHGYGTGPPIKADRTLAPYGDTDGPAVSTNTNFMRWQVMSGGTGTGITPNNITLPIPANHPLRYFTMPFSTQVSLRFWIRRPAGLGTSWTTGSALVVNMAWFWENDFAQADGGGAAFGFNVSATRTYTVDSIPTNTWTLIDFTGTVAWTYGTQPPEAQGIVIGINFNNFFPGSVIDMDKFQLRPGRFNDLIGDVIIPPLPTDPIPVAGDVHYDRTYCYDIASGGWSRWSLGHQVEVDQPVNYSRPQPHTQDRFNYVTGGGMGLPLLSADPWSEVIDDANPVAWWRFDEESGDFEDSGTSGITLVNTGSPVTYEIPGQIDNSIQTNTFASIHTATYEADLNPPEISAECWFSIQAALNGTLFTCTDGSYGYSCNVNATGVVNVGAGDGASVTFVQSATGAADVGEWVHVVWTNDGTTGSLYVNGVLVDSDTQAYVPQAATQLFWVARSAGSSSELTAWVDELVIYDYVLEPEEVFIHFTAGPEVEAPPLTVAGGYYTLEHRRDMGDKFYDPDIVEEIPSLQVEPTPWEWTSGTLVPAVVPHHEIQIADSHVNLSTVGPVPTGGAEIEISSRFNGTNPNPPTVSSVTPNSADEAQVQTEQIRSGYLGRGQYPQVHLEGGASGELFIHAIDLETEVDPRP